VPRTLQRPRRASARTAPQTRRRVIAFDLDNTLAESKSPITVEMAGLLDRLLARFQVCVPWECFGYIDNIVFVQGAVPRPDGTIYLTYGAADRCVGAASVAASASGSTGIRLMTSTVRKKNDRNDAEALHGVAPVAVPVQSLLPLSLRRFHDV
jgi:beta-1,4-mannooligosaccharide phosphorylase